MKDDALDGSTSPRWYYIVLFVSIDTIKAEICGTISDLVLDTVLIPSALAMPLLSPYAIAIITATLLGIFTMIVMLEEKDVMFNLHTPAIMSIIDTSR